VSSGNYLTTFWGQITGPKSKGINSWPLTFQDNLAVPISRDKILDLWQFRTTYQSHLLTLEDGADRLSQNDDHGTNTTHVITQNSTVLIWFTVEAWNNALISQHYIKINRSYLLHSPKGILKCTPPWIWASSQC
jgi:hypothetical protein